MKKLTAITLSLLCTLTLSACDSGEIPESSDERSSTVSENTSSEISESEPESSEPEVPAGEPTFLTCPDGTVIYTSQITKYQEGAEFLGTHEHVQYPLGAFNKETFTTPECLQAVCEGFTYGFFPRLNVNVTESPEKFTETE